MCRTFEVYEEDVRLQDVRAGSEWSLVWELDLGDIVSEFLAVGCVDAPDETQYRFAVSTPEKELDVGYGSLLVKFSRFDVDGEMTPKLNMYVRSADADVIVDLRLLFVGCS